MAQLLHRSFFRLLSLIGLSKRDKTKHVTRHFKLRDTKTGYPYLSGDLFRACSHHIVDATGVPFYPEKVKAEEVVFVKTKYLNKFLKYMHPYIKNPYVLITHNGDEESPGDFSYLLEDQKIIKWFGCNATLSHPKMVPLPIGHGNCGQDNSFENLISYLQQNPVPKQDLLYLNISVHTHPDRPAVKQYFSTLPYCKVDVSRPAADYMRALMGSKFTISPRGNGIDCHRVWESLLVGTIPVLKTTPLDPLYRALPVLIVDDWKEVTQPFLEMKYQEMATLEYNFNKLHADYWLNLLKPYIGSLSATLWEQSRVKAWPKGGDALRDLFWQSREIQNRNRIDQKT